MNVRPLIVVTGLMAGAISLPAWDYAGHRVINELALAALPADFPAFVHEPANAERIAFLAGEPDRWRNTPDLPIKHYNGIDHYLDMEQLPAAGLDPAKVPSLRYEFALQFAAGRATHSARFAPIDPGKNPDHSREWPGFLPWAITEHYGKLKSGFSSLKTFEQYGTADEVANAKASILYVMGVMGHYVGDGAQPLHTTNHHNGWVGDNPHGYTTRPGIHGWIDGGFMAKTGISTVRIRARVTPVRPITLTQQPDGRDPMFVAAMRYLLKQHAQVEPLYALEQAGGFKAENSAGDSAGRDFIEGQLLEGGEMLGAIWLTAWRNAAPDSYLEKQLLRRRESGAKP